jgi:hypothetical protein
MGPIFGPKNGQMSALRPRDHLFYQTFIHHNSRCEVLCGRTGLSFLADQKSTQTIYQSLHINELSVYLGQYFQYDSQTICCSFHKYRTDSIRKGKETDRQTLLKIGRC